MLANAEALDAYLHMKDNGWRSRGYLPHCDERGLVQHIVFGLNDGFRSPPNHVDDSIERALWADREFDIGHGSCLLAKAQHASTVQDACFTATANGMPWRLGA